MTLLAGRVYVVAGIGPGLGSVLAQRIVAHSGRVVVVARTSDRVHSLVAELGDRAHGVVADLADPEAGTRVVESATDRFGRLDGLVYNAASIPPLHPITESDARTRRTSLAVAVEGPWSLVAAARPALVAAGGGSVVLVGSAIVRHPKPGFGAYNVAKHAALGLARSLALELGPDGIRVNTLAVGKIAGDRLQTYFADLAAARGSSVDDVEAEYASRIATGTIPEPAAHADAAVFLLSDLSRAVTGHTLDTNGGEYFD